MRQASVLEVDSYSESPATATTVVVGSPLPSGQRIMMPTPGIVSHPLKNYDSRNAGRVCFKSTFVTPEEALVLH